MPETVERIVAMVSNASGLSVEEVRRHRHFREGFSFARMVEAYRPDYLQSYFFYEGSLFTFIASYLLGIPRGIRIYADYEAADYELNVLPLHLKQSNLVVTSSDQAQRKLLDVVPEEQSHGLLLKSESEFPGYLRSLLDSSELSVVSPTIQTETNKQPLVSIIVIFLNGAKFIEEAVESIFAQTFENWELLLVDDGSTDGSTDIARAFAKAHPHKVRYLEHANHENLGMSATRNLGIREACGEFIAFLDSDDVWLANKLERQLAIMRDHADVSMVYGATRYWYSWTGNPEDSPKDNVPELGVETNRVFPPPLLSTLLYPLGTATAPCPSDILLRRHAVEKIGRFEETFAGPNQLYEDQAFLAKLYLHEPVFVSNETWTWYRIHPESCMSVVTGAGQYDSVRQFFLTWFEKYLSEEKVNNVQISGAIQDAVGSLQSAAIAVGQVTQTQGNGSGSKHFGGEKSLTQNGRGSRTIQFGALRQLKPISSNWGFDRGLPVDRYYIESFLRSQAEDIQGHVLEIEDNSYTRKFGGARISKSDVLHVNEGNPRATIVGDLTGCDHIPSDTFDCIILTQTLHLIYDTRAALRTLNRILKPGGTLLATFPGITRISHEEWADSWFWSFTTASARRLFADAFPGANIDVQAHGNVLAAVSFLHGVATDDLVKDELDYRDSDYEVLITVRAAKAL